MDIVVQELSRIPIGDLIFIILMSVFFVVVFGSMFLDPRNDLSSAGEVGPYLAGEGNFILWKILLFVVLFACVAGWLIDAIFK